MITLAVDLAGQPVTVVGGGAVAWAKLSLLVDEGAAVTVVAPEAVTEIRGAAAEGRLVWAPRAYRTGDLDGALLAVAATDDPGVNDIVVGEASRNHILCVRAGAGARPGTATVPGTVRRGPLTLAVSTAGHAPALARRIRAELETAYGPEYGDLVALLGQLRADPAVQAGLAGCSEAERRARWRAIPVPDILTLLRNGDVHSARELARSCLSSASA